MPQRVVCFIREIVQCVRHLVVSLTVIIFAKVFMLIPVGMSDVVEWSAKENIESLTQ